MGGIILNQPLPVRGLDQIDPFLLIHHGNLPAKKGAKPSEVGVGPHPHRGFSPVTFVYKGSMHHRDSIGNSELVKDGGTQWMHSGKGIVHSERPGKDQLENGGDSEFIQFWVNSPSKYKMEAPYYLPITDEGTPKIKDDKMTIAVVAGEFENIKGPAKTYSPQTLLRFEAEPGAERSINIPSNFNTLIYVLNGDIELNGQKAKSKDMVWFNNDGEEIQFTVKEDSRFIVLSGEPIGEEVSTYGPFVMNTETEIREAILDYQSGKMGTLVEQF
jgi:hypothetical protein